MLKRSIVEGLNAWKKNKNGKCLMIQGARQVGKTYIIRYFGHQEYKAFYEINFLESPESKKIFSGNLDVKTLTLNFSLYIPDFRIISGNTLIFLDEIQECPEAITALKFLAAEAAFDVIVSGSMLGIDYNRPSSYPVGSVSYLNMYSLDFGEFLDALNINKDVITVLEESMKAKKEIPAAVHDKMMEYLRLYMVLGGMPAVMNTYLKTNSLLEADRVQREILKDYRYDIAHYASPDIKLKAEKCYFSIADQLSKENHKFKYSVVEKGGTKRKFGSSIDWLEGAYLIKPVVNVKGYSVPLSSNKEEGNFRIYPTDIGLFTAMYDFSIKEKLLMSKGENIDGNLRGGLYEALVADMLIKSDYKELYFRKNESSTFEIEFLIESSEGVVPIEVKAGKSRSRSLDNLLKRDEIPYGYKFTGGNIGMSGKKITLPLYMASFIYLKRK